MPKKPATSAFADRYWRETANDAAYVAAMFVRALPTVDYRALYEAFNRVVATPNADEVDVRDDELFSRSLSMIARLVEGTMDDLLLSEKDQMLYVLRIGVIVLEKLAAIDTSLMNERTSNPNVN